MQYVQHLAVVVIQMSVGCDKVKHAILSLLTID